MREEQISYRVLQKNDTRIGDSLIARVMKITFGSYFKHHTYRESSVFRTSIIIYYFQTLYGKMQNFTH